MPRTPKKRSTSDDSDSDVKPYSKPTKLVPKSPKKTWTQEERQTILFTICEQAQIDWDKVADKLPGRTATQAKDQWRQVMLPNFKKNGNLGPSGTR